MLTKVYHPNISDNGAISVSTCYCHYDEWSPAKFVSTLLVEIRNLLAEPNPEHPLVPDIAKQYK